MPLSRSPKRNPFRLTPPPASPSPSDVDVLAALLGRPHGPHRTDPVALHLLDAFGGLAGIARASVAELKSIAGVGPARAARIRAALVLGRRSLEVVRERPGPYRGAKDVFEFLQPKVAGQEKEMFFALLLDSKNRLVRDELVSVGTLTASLVHPREVFRPAIRAAAAAIIIAHNHPSGCADPSAEDLDVTARLRSAGELIGIPVLDHVIIGAGTYTSLAERGRMDDGRTPK